MDDILTKYEDISKYTCLVCGKIIVPVFDDGWISPFCPECYKKQQERIRGNRVTDEVVNEIIAESPNSGM